jgi:hypothetical protein
VTSAPGPSQIGPTTITEVIAQMERIDGTLPRKDGVAYFNRLYLQVTKAVEAATAGVTFAAPEFTERLDVVFAALYFAAEATIGTGAMCPIAWRPLVEERAEDRAPIQFAIVGMNAHINHDLPVAMVNACTALATAPETGSHLADYQKVDGLLDAAEQSVRQSFESAPELAVDRHLSAVATVIGNWSINSARDMAWKNCLLLWAVRHDPVARGLLLDSLAASTAMASRLLLVAV